MENSKLIHLLKTFDVTELREFNEFLQSPLHNKNQDLLHFYEYLRKVAPKFLPKKIEKTTVFRQLYPKKKYEDKTMRYLMSFTLKLAEEFIGLKKYQDQKNLVQTHILEALIDRDLEKNYQNIYQKTSKKLKSSLLRDTNFYYEQYLLTEISNKHFASKNLRKFNNQLQVASNNFDIYYLARKLQYSCSMMSMQRFLSADYSQDLIEEISHFLKRKTYEDVPAIDIYYQVFLTLTDEKNEQNFEKLVVLLNKYDGFFSKEEMQGFYLHAINYCLRKIRQKEEKYVSKTLEIYIKGVENKYLLNKGLLSPFTYKNIIKIGLRLKRFTWTEQFIKQYTPILEAEYRLNAYNYGLADLSFHKNEISTALTHLREVEFTDIFFTLDAKIMLLKIYFDEQEEEALLSLLASFSIFLKRNKLISNEVRETYINFINFLNKIMKTDPINLDAIATEVQEAKLLTDRNWLLTIIEKKK